MTARRMLFAALTGAALVTLASAFLAVADWWMAGRYDTERWPT